MVSCCLSATGVRFSVILFPPGSWALLTVGLPNTPKARPDPDGVTPFRTHEQRPGRAPSKPRGQRCSPRPRRLPAGRRPHHSGQSLHPAALPIDRGRITRHSEGSRNSPVRSSPRLWPPGWNGPPLDFPRASHPADQEPDDARRGRDRPSSTDLGPHAQLTSADLQSGSPLAMCDLGSHVAKAIARREAAERTDAIVREDRASTVQRSRPVGEEIHPTADRGCVVPGKPRRACLLDASSRRLDSVAAMAIEQRRAAVVPSSCVRAIRGRGLVRPRATFALVVGRRA